MKPVDGSLKYCNDPSDNTLSRIPPEELRRIASPSLEAGDGAIRLPGSSHAEATLAGRVDVHVADDIRVVQTLIKRSGKSV